MQASIFSCSTAFLAWEMLAVLLLAMPSFMVLLWRQTGAREGGGERDSVNVTLNQHPSGDSSTLMEQLLYYNLTPTRSFLHSKTWKDPFCLSICYLKKLLCGHQLDSGLSFFSQHSCMIAFLPLSRYYLDQLAGGEVSKEWRMGGIKTHTQN